MNRPADILIGGGGVIGLTTAYFLAREGAAVVLVDSGDFGREASWAGAGILPPGDLDAASGAFSQLRAHGATLHQILAEELREATGIDNGYVRCGGIELAAGPGQIHDEEWRCQGTRCEQLDATALHRLEPALAPELCGGDLLPDMAQVRNPRHLRALVAACAALGVELRPGCPIQALVLRGSRVVSVTTPAGELSAGQYLLAAGAWSDGLLEPTGWRPGIRPIRGQIALLNTGPPLLRRIVLQGPRYLVPRPDGRVLIGSTEENAGFVRQTTAGAIAGLLQFGTGLVPALALAPVERCWAGLRPGSPDGLPFLGRVPNWENLYLAAGHFRSGILLSSITGLLMKQLMLGQALILPVENYRLDRTTDYKAISEVI